MTSPMIWDYDIYETVSKVEVLEATIALQGMDAFGKVSGGRISLRGRLQWATIDTKVDN